MKLNWSDHYAPALFMLAVVVAFSLIFVDKISKAQNSKLQLDCVIQIVKQPAFTCDLVRLNDDYYLRCALAVTDTALFYPTTLLVVNEPDTMVFCQWPLLDHHLQPKLGAMPDELFIFAVDEKQLKELLAKPDCMLFLIIGANNRMLVIRITPKFKNTIINLLNWNDKT